MKNPLFTFTEIDSANAFSKLGNSLGGKAINNTIRIPGDNGQGTIRKIDFEKGLHIRVWDFTLTQPFNLHRLPQNNSETGKAFTIVYILSSDTIYINSPVFRKEIMLHGNMNIILISDDIDINFLVNPGHPVKAIDVTISSEWMKAQFNDADPQFRSFIDKMKTNIKPSVFIESGSGVEYRTAMELHDYSLSGSKGMLYLKAKTLSLISDFLGRSSTQNSRDILEGNVLHKEKMVLVEKFLAEHFEKNLPSIELIARQAALSESTLKRHFKMMFGKSIYEYYLEKKMEYAKTLLLEKPLTVKEIAYRLGYEKTSNFIRIFKKFHVYSPGLLKKKIAL